MDDLNGSQRSVCLLLFEVIATTFKRIEARRLVALIANQYGWFLMEAIGSTGEKLVKKVYLAYLELSLFKNMNYNPTMSSIIQDRIE
uniref:Uncharacterized protein n=1 Tax=Romanomermis culicivorax TaxID=13658 RepID=A0A915L3H2_ROMCU